MKHELATRLRLTPDEAVRHDAADLIEYYADENRMLRQELASLRNRVSAALCHLGGCRKSSRGGVQRPRTARGARVQSAEGAERR